MSPKDSTSTAGTETVYPLNITDRQAYVASFRRSVPRHLGIAINLIWKEGDSDAEKKGQEVAKVLARAAIQLLESDPFRQQYLSPLGVQYFQTQFIGSSSLDVIWNQCPHVAAEWTVDDLAIVVAFYDPDIGGPELAGKVYGSAMIVLRECIAESGSVEPTTHNPIVLRTAEAQDYINDISSLYEDGVGLWCESLVPLWEVLMVKLHTFLKSIPTN